MEELVNKKSYFGNFGGQFVPETLMPILEELDKSYNKQLKNKKYRDELKYYLREFADRPTPP